MCVLLNGEMESLIDVWELTIKIYFLLHKTPECFVNTTVTLLVTYCLTLLICLELTACLTPASSCLPTAPVEGFMGLPGCFRFYRQPGNI